jgi:hypothetical protein
VSPSPQPRAIRLLGVVVLAGIVAASAAIRIGCALADPNFDRENPASLLSTDPAFLYYLTERIVDGGGLPPDDFHADPRIEYPDLTDVPAGFTLGQEFVVAWAHLLQRRLGGDVPQHVVAVWAMGISAALVGVGVYGLALELAGSVGWALAAAALWALSLVNYRSVGYVLFREDFTLPWFALHGFLLARAVRVRTPASFVLAALATVAAAATWHAMTFVLAIEAAAILVWALRTGENPLRARHAWVFPVVVGVLSLVVPVLRAKLFVLSLPMLVAWALLAAAHVPRRGRLVEAVVIVATAGAGLGLARLLSRLSGAGLGDYSHVFALLAAKIRFLGMRPEDPRALPFEARLLWEGPFDTATLDYVLPAVNVLLVGVVGGAVIGLRDWLRGRGDARVVVLFVFTAATAVLGVLISRLFVVVGVMAPVTLVVLLGRVPQRALRTALLVVALVVPGVILHRYMRHFQSPWYMPPEWNAERADVMAWISEHVPRDEPIASDYVNSAAILASAGNPVLLQPKYEVARSRQRIEGFFDAFFHGTPDDLRRWVRDAGARWLLIDRNLMRGRVYIGGKIPSEVRAEDGTADLWLLNPNPEVFAAIPGYELVYRSPLELGWDSYRLYRLE